MLLNMERVCKTYGDRTLLDHVTFYMKQGDRVGVVGVNGCGKSTFLRLAAGRESPPGGDGWGLGAEAAVDSPPGAPMGAARPLRPGHQEPGTAGTV